MLRRASLLVSVLPLLVCADVAETNQITIDGSTGVKPLVSALARTYQNDDTNPRISIGTGLKPKARIQALLNQDIDIAMASHGIDAKQIAQHGLTVHRIAKVAVVMGVNRSVDIDVLSHQQLCDIYAGKITQWAKLSGQSLAVTPFVRPFSEVDTEVIANHVDCFSKDILVETIPVKKKSGHMAKALANTYGAIGMTTQVRVAQSKGAIIALSLNGVQPNATNLQNGRYPFSRDLYLITASQPSQHVAAFLAFIRSAAGHEIILANHAVPAHCCRKIDC